MNNNLSNNPAFLKRMENAVELPAEESSVDILTVGLYLLAITGTAAIAYKLFEPRIVVNHYYPPNQSDNSVPRITASKISTQAQN